MRYLCRSRLELPSKSSEGSEPTGDLRISVEQLPVVQDKETSDDYRDDHVRRIRERPACLRSSFHHHRSIGMNTPPATDCAWKPCCSPVFVSYQSVRDTRLAVEFTHAYIGSKATSGTAGGRSRLQTGVPGASVDETDGHSRVRDKPNEAAPMGPHNDSHRTPDGSNEQLYL